MKAVVWTAYGPPDVLQFQEVEKPIPKDREVLIRVHATTVTAGDCEMRRMGMMPLFRIPMRIYVGLSKPSRVTILGMELAGEIEAAGADVRRFKKGDQVWGTAGLHAGTYAEYVCVPEQSEEGALALKPANLSYEEAAAVPLGGMEALHHLRRANVRSGEKVLINGAGGTIGTFAVQLAKYFGAEVTAVDHTAKLDMLRSIGADHVIDYTREDFARSARTYDVILDVVGKSPYSHSFRALKQGGRLVLANPSLSDMLRAPWARASGRRVLLGAATYASEDLGFLAELIAAGSIRPVIDRRYTLDQTAEAHRYVEQGHKKGNVVITVAQGGKD